VIDYGTGRASDAEDATNLTEFGYKPSLKRTMGALDSFALAFSMISISVAAFFLFSNFFTTIGGCAIWLWIPVAMGVLMIVLVYAHLAARIPLTGYAYQWNSRLVSAHYGWFSGWTALVAFLAGTASVGMAIASIFGPEIWAKPTSGQLIGLAGASILAAAILNIISIRATSFINNVGVTFEIVGSLGAALVLYVGAAFFFPHVQGWRVVLQLGAADGSKVTWMSLGAAALLPVYTLLGWEGSADLAEETKDPRRITPHAMIRANYTSVIASIFMIVAFMIAIPHGIKALVNQPENALLYIFRAQLGNLATDVLEFVVFFAIFSCLLANMAVAVRVCYSLARDKMLPASSVLGRVGSHTGTPIWSVVLVAVLAFGVNLLSSDVANNVVSIVNVACYMTYALTMIAVLIGLRRGLMPAGLPGGFSLGRLLQPVAVLGLVFAIVIIADMTLPASDHVAAEYAIGSEALGIIWYFVYVRGRLSAGTIGPNITDVKLESSPSLIGAGD
jgi:amino acid transporter